jgi:hypothetical protein
MNGDILLSEWAKMHLGWSIPNFTLLGGGVPDVLAHLAVFFVFAVVVTNIIFWAYDYICLKIRCSRR